MRYFEIPIQITFDEFLEAVYSKNLIRKYGIFLYFSAIWLVGLIVLQISHLKAGIQWLAFGPPSFFLFIALGLAYFDVRRQWSRLPIMAEAKTCTITDDSLILASHDDKIEYRWQHFLGSFKTQKSSVLILNGYKFLVLPNTSFAPTQLQNLKEAISHNIDEHKLHEWNKSQTLKQVVFIIALYLLLYTIIKLIRP